MAVENTPPVLKKITTPSSDAMLDVLKSIDSRLQEIAAFSKAVKTIEKNKPTKKSKAKKQVIEFKPYVLKNREIGRSLNSIVSLLVRDIKLAEQRKEAQLTTPDAKKGKKTVPLIKKGKKGKKTVPLIKKGKKGKKTVPLTKRKKIPTEKKLPPPVVPKKSSVDLLRERYTELNAVKREKPDLSGLSFKDKKEIKQMFKQTRKENAQKFAENAKEAREEILSKGFLSKQDKKDLRDLKKIEKKGKKLDFSTTWLGSKIDTLGSNFEKGTSELAQGTVQGLLGPLNLLLDPIADTFGIKFEDLFGKKDEFTRKGKQIKPKRSDILKSNPEIVWAEDQRKKDKAKESNKEDGDLLGKLGAAGGIAALAKSLWPTLAKAAPLAAIAGGLVWAVLDGMKTVGEADKWGVTKVEAFLGGFFSGSGEGWQNILANAGKWGLTGLGIGTMVGGPVGAIAGVLVGAALGGIFGWIGAENTSQGLRDLGLKLGITKPTTQGYASLEEAQTKKEKIITTFSKVTGNLKDAKAVEDALTSLKAGLNSSAGENEFIKGQEQALILNEIDKRVDKINSFGDKLTKDQQKEKEKLVSEINSLRSMFYELKEKKEKGRFSTNISALMKKYKMDFPTIENDKPIATTKVNDAIVTPQGRIITPSPDDTIIATKSRVTKGFDSENMKIDIDQISKAIEQSFDAKEIVNAINQLISVVKNKPFNNIIQQTSSSSIDFDKLRFTT